MNVSVEAVSNSKTCDLCGFTTDNDEDVISFGDWMQRQGITVHYFCLLLSTNLPQRGQDTNGILGFLVRDIRIEIRDAKTRKCSYCDGMNASIACYTCKKYFHLVCGHRYDCSFQFIGDFRSYCDECVPLDDCQQRNKQNPPQGERCHICIEPMGKFNPITWTYGRCCGNGYVHRLCLRRYALAAGYYLICIWCRSKEFRNDVRLLGIFVPDRDARWEREKNAYADLHRGHKSCNMNICNCPKGRDYMRGYWSKIIVCSLCGSFGAHNPGCIPGYERTKGKLKSFTCDPCRCTTESMANRVEESNVQRAACRDFVVDYQLQMNKMPTVESLNNTSPPQQRLNETPQFSEDESISFSSSVTTVRAAPCFKPTVELEPSAETAFENMQVDDDESPADTADETPDDTRDETHNVTVITLEDTTQELDENKKNSQEATSKQNASPSKVRNTKHSSPKSVYHTTESNPKTTQEIYIVENWPEFDQQLNVLSTCKVRIDLSNPRFAGKSIEEICSFNGMQLIEDADKFDRISGPGIFQIVNDLITETVKAIDKVKMDRICVDKTDESFQSLRIIHNKSKAKENERSMEEAMNCSVTVLPQKCNKEEKQKLNQKKNAEQNQEKNQTHSEENLKKSHQEQDLKQNQEQEKNLEMNKEPNQKQYPKGNKHEQEANQEHNQVQNHQENQEKKTKQNEEQKHELIQKQNLATNRQNKQEENQEQNRKQNRIHHQERHLTLLEAKVTAATKSPPAPDTNNNNEIPSKISAGTQQLIIVEDWPEFDEHLNVLSTCKVRIDLNNPRFKGKTIDDICSFEGMRLISDADKFDRISGPGIFKAIDDFIAENSLLYKKQSKSGDLKKNSLELS